jgi:hypothetical protein
MSFILEADGGRDLQVNSWNWGVLHELVIQARLFPEDVWAPFRYNCGAALDADQVRLLAEFLEKRILPRLGEDGRMFFDGRVTDVPDDGTFFRDPKEMEKNYSLHRGVLIQVIDFLKTAGGPVTVF